MDAAPDAEVIDGRFVVGAVIGRGAMGEVRRGRDLRLDRDVAVKFLRADLAADERVRARFEDEAKAAARLSHPAIVTVFDSGEWNGAPYLVMECLPGRTLADELTAGPLGQDRVRAVGADIAGALDVAHRLGVIHRDVKPGNILLTDSGRAKLADFGIAKSTEGLDHTITGAIIGTPSYLAPERLAGLPATASSDIYALGVVLYEAVTGERPFVGDTPIALAHAIHTSTPVPLAQRQPQLDQRLAAAIDRAMARAPEQRWASAAAMLAAISDDSPTAVPTSSGAARDTLVMQPVATPATGEAPGRVEGWWRQRTRRGQQLIVATAVLLGVLLAVTAARDDWDRARPPETTDSPPSTASPLPAPLDDAIAELEELMQP